MHITFDCPNCQKSTRSEVVSLLEKSEKYFFFLTKCSHCLLPSEVAIERPSKHPATIIKGFWGHDDIPVPNANSAG